MGLVVTKLRFVETSVIVGLLSIVAIRVYINSGTNNVQLGHFWQSCLILCHIIVIGHESGFVETCFD